MPDSDKSPNRLLEPGDQPAVIVANPGAGGPFLFIGDHAGREIPARLGNLGLGAAELDRHIAWDIGVGAVGAALSSALRAPFIRQVYSRLVIDCNRIPGTSQSIPVVSDGVVIPGNVGLEARHKVARLEEIYWPYHRRIAAELDDRRERGEPTVIVSLHSFTPRLQGVERPWRFGVLHRGDSPFSASMIEVMSAKLGAEVGDNQPYAMDATDNTVPLHADSRGLDYLELEIRQDLIGDAAGQDFIARQIAGFLAQARAPAAPR